MLREGQVLEDMAFTGERFVPGAAEGDIELEHLHRYSLVCELAKGKRILDVASGEGYGSAMLAAHAAEVTGVDISEEAIRHASDKYVAPNLRFVHGSCSALPLPDAAVDMVVSFETLEHHDQHEAMMREIKRVLRPGGVLVISSPDKLEYSEKPGYVNEFHVKELYRCEFQELLTRHFAHYRLYGQRVAYGSVVLSEDYDGPQQAQSYTLEDHQLQSYAGVPHAVYLIAVVSDGHLPTLNIGIFNLPLASSPLVKMSLEHSSRLERAVDELRDTLDSVTVDRDAHKAAAGELQQRMADLERTQRGQLEDLNRVIGEKDFLLKKIYGSKSWRITAPLRYLARLLSGIRGSISNGTTIGSVPEAPQITNNQIESRRATDISNSNDQRHSDSAQRYRILLVSYYYPSRAHAGGLRILDIYALIKQRCPNVQLDLLTHHRPSIDGSIADSHQIFDHVYLSPVEDLSPSCLHGLQSNGKFKYDVVDLQFHQAAYHLEEYKRIASKVIFTPMESLAKVLYLEMQNQIRMNHRFGIKELLAQFKFAYEEISFCRNVDHVVCVSKTDAAFIRSVGGGHKVRAIETGISPLEFAEALTNGFSQVSAKERPKKIIYVAYFESQTNINALNWYLQKVHPRVIKAVPDYQLVVVGRGDLSSFEVYRGPQVELVGEVPILTPYIKSAKIGIAPALGGSGFRGKVNQYAVLGIPAVVSPIALQGLVYRDGESVFVADDSSDFADRCIELLSDDDLNDRMAHEARKLCMKNYSWGSKWPQISEVYGLQGNYAC